MGICLGTQITKVESSCHDGSGNSSTVSSPRKNRSPSAGTTHGVDVLMGISKELSLSSNDEKEAALRAFSCADLRSATKNFRSVLGEGGFGCVFKGFIDEQTFLPSRAGKGMPIAVKKLNLTGLQGHKEWLAEVRFLGALHHPNLVRLIGFCAEECHRLLVYEFMPRGSLDNHLFQKGNSHRNLSWATRMKIAIGAARGLTFLHEAKSPVIFRDLKAANILLDLEYNAKLSDFGLAKDGPTGGKTHVSTRVMGSLGYAAPEYLVTGHLTLKSDVYSFGVVLLEILTGLKTVDKTRPCVDQNLVDWARPYLSDRNQTLLIMDKRLEDQYPPRGALRAAHIAHCCLNPEAKYRPTMSKILQALEPLLNAEDISKYATGIDEDGKLSQQQGRNGGSHGEGFTLPQSSKTTNRHVQKQ